MIRTAFSALVATTMLAAPQMASSQSGDTIVDVASGNENLSTLVEAVQAAELAETLSGEGPFTVFAPTNEAFEALPDGVLDALLMEENKETLTEILQHHVIEGAVMSSDLENDMEAETMNGSVTIMTEDGVQVGDASVTEADVEASNGVVHVIDAVLIPEGVDPSSLASGS